MATFKDVLKVALERDIATMQSVNRNLMEVSKSTKKKSGYIKVAVSDEVAASYISGSRGAFAGFIINIDGDVLNEIAKEIDDKENEDARV